LAPRRKGASQADTARSRFGSDSRFDDGKALGQPEARTAGTAEHRQLVPAFLNPELIKFEVGLGDIFTKESMTVCSSTKWLLDPYKIIADIHVFDLNDPTPRSARRKQRRLKVSKWQNEKAERNRQSLARLTKALPHIFPSAVLSHALSRPFVSPTPRLAIDSYWRAHPIRADHLARSLAALTGAPSGWTWRLGDERESGLPANFRTPPGPYRKRQYALGPGFCCVCGQPVYRFGWHVDLWDGTTETRGCTALA
jgi:hypothetical protein